MSKYRIRPATAADVPELVQLCAEHAVYEESVYSTTGKATKLTELLFSTPPRLYCLVVETALGLAGYATYIRQLSTWDADYYMYLDCLFLRANLRGQGIGKQLMHQIAQAAQQQNCLCIQWQTPKWNTNAIKFYKRLGAVSKSKERFFLDPPTLSTHA